LKQIRRRDPSITITHRTSWRFKMYSRIQWRLLTACVAVVASALTACDQGPHPLTPAVGARLGSPGDASLARASDEIEHGYINGSLVSWQFPSSYGNNQNELVLPDCFRVGPDLTDHPATGHVGRLYAAFLPGATLHSCPDGSDLHDHILSGGPGSENTTLWDLIEAWPTATFDPSIMPITSEAALLAAVAAGQVVLIDDQILLHAVVIGHMP
jgi:hypothetical protein